MNHAPSSKRPLFALAALAAVLVASLACAGEKKGAAAAPAGPPAGATEDQKTIYALGLAISGNIGGFELTEADLAALHAGISDGVLGRAKFEPTKDGPKLQALQQSRTAAAAEVQKKAGAAFLEKAEKEAGVKKTPSGLLYKEIKAGSGESPKPTDKVKVHYRGTSIDGVEFDSSIGKPEPATMNLGQMIPCWSEGIPMMKIGGKSRLICPPAIGFGDRGSPPVIKPGATLVFEVELFSIEKPTT